MFVARTYKYEEKKAGNTGGYTVIDFVVFAQWHKKEQACDHWAAQFIAIQCFLAARVWVAQVFIVHVCDFSHAHVMVLGSVFIIIIINK